MHSKRGRKRKVPDGSSSIESPDSPDSPTQHVRIKTDDLEVTEIVHVPPAVRYGRETFGPTQFSIPPDPLFGHHFFVSANFAQRLRLFVDMPAALSLTHQPQLWQKLFSMQAETLPRVPTNAAVLLLVYAAAGLVGS